MSPGSGPGLLGRVDELLGRRVSMRSLALLRMLVGPVVVLHLWPFVADALDGRTYHDTFHEAYASWYPELSPGPYSVMLYVGVVAAVAMTLGAATRVTAPLTFAIVAYNVFLSTTHFHNNRAFLMIVLAGLAVGPCGRELSVDEWWRARRGRPALATDAPAWPLWLLRFEACVLYGASGLSKLLDRDWFGGTVTYLRVVHHRADLVASPLPDWALDLLLDRSFHTFAAKAIVLTELAIAVGLWSQTTRRAAIWLAVCFHVAIQLTAEVEVFSYLALATLVIWATPSTRDRTLAVRATSRLARAVHHLDWLARFRFAPEPASASVPPTAPGTTGAPVPAIEGRGSVPAPGDGTPAFAALGDDRSAVSVGPSGGRAGAGAGGGDAVVMWDRDGSVRTGRGATLFALSRLPLIAWFFLPTLLLPSVRHSRRLAADGREGHVGESTVESESEQPARGGDPAAGGRDESVSAMGERGEG